MPIQYTLTDSEESLAGSVDRKNMVFGQTRGIRKLESLCQPFRDHLSQLYGAACTRIFFQRTQGLSQCIKHELWGGMFWFTNR